MAAANDPYFRPAYNAWQLEQQVSCRAALVKAAESAVKRIIESLPYDPKLAWHVIKELGVASRPKSLSVDPKHVQMEIAVERREEESVLLERIERELEGDLPVAAGRVGAVVKSQTRSANRSIAGTRSELSPRRAGRQCERGRVAQVTFCRFNATFVSSVTYKFRCLHIARLGATVLGARVPE